MQAGYRHIKLGVVRVQQVQEFVRSIAEVECREPQVAADAVLLVHDRIADAHFRQIAQHRIDVAAPRIPLARSAHDTRIKLGLGDQRHVRAGPDETGVQRTRDQRRARVAGDELGPVGDHRRLETVLREILLHGFAAAEALRCDQYALGGGGDMAFERAQRIVGTAIDLDGGKGMRGVSAARSLGARGDGPGRRRCGVRIGFHDRRLGRVLGGCGVFAGPRHSVRGELDAGERLEHAMELVLRHEQLARREQRPRTIASQQPVARVGVLPETPDRRGYVAMQADDSLGRQILGQRRGRIEKQRQVILDTGRHDAVRHILVQR